MNHVTFNDSLKGINSLSFGPEFEKEVSILLSRDLLESPLFDSEPNDELAEAFIQDKIDKTPHAPGAFVHDQILRSLGESLSRDENILPFKRFRLSIKSDQFSKDLGFKQHKYWISHRAGSLTLISSPGGPASDWIDLLHVPKDSIDIRVVSTFKGEIVDNKFLADHGLGKLPDDGRARFSQILWFIVEYLAPENFVASVTPSKKGKSVEWQQARTHYVLLNRHHPANDKAVMKGAKVAEGEEYIQRRAHSRRAHARILRSPRFRNKIGQTIRVKACWVGPDEWEQFGSIYRMTKLSPNS